MCGEIAEVTGEKGAFLFPPYLPPEEGYEGKTTAQILHGAKIKGSIDGE